MMSCTFSLLFFATHSQAPIYVGPWLRPIASRFGFDLRLQYLHMFVHAIKNNILIVIIKIMCICVFAGRPVWIWCSFHAQNENYISLFFDLTHKLTLCIYFFTRHSANCLKIMIITQSLDIKQYTWIWYLSSNDCVHDLPVHHVFWVLLHFLLFGSMAFCQIILLELLLVQIGAPLFNVAAARALDRRACS